MDPEFTIIGWKGSTIKDSDTVLNLVEISFQTDEIYALYTDKELEDAISVVTKANFNVLGDHFRYHKSRSGIEPRQVLVAASYNSYGSFIAPPKWEVLQEQVPNAFRMPIALCS